MDQVIRERVKVDARGAVVLIDGRLRPGEEVDVTVRPVAPSANGSLLKTARGIDLNAPADYSERFEDVLLPPDR